MKFLTRTPVIWSLGLATVALTVAFGFWIRAYDLHILDRISSADEIKAVVAAMSDVQKTSHWWMTLVLDYAYPLAYGGFFAGLALRGFGKLGVLAAIPAFICIVADIIENTAQLMILKGMESPIAIKTVMTPLKVWTFLIAAVIALVALLVLIWRWWRARAA